MAVPPFLAAASTSELPLTKQRVAPSAARKRTLTRALSAHASAARAPAKSSPRRSPTSSRPTNSVVPAAAGPPPSLATQPLPKNRIGARMRPQLQQSTTAIRAVPMLTRGRRPRPKRRGATFRQPPTSSRRAHPTPPKQQQQLATATPTKSINTTLLTPRPPPAAGVPITTAPPPSPLTP